MSGCLPLPAIIGHLCAHWFTHKMIILGSVAGHKIPTGGVLRSTISKASQLALSVSWVSRTLSKLEKNLVKTQLHTCALHKVTRIC